MAKFIGRLSQIGVGTEVTRGTAVASAIGVKWLDLTLETKVESTRNEQAFGNIAIADGSTIVNRYGEITAKCKVHDISLGYFLYATFGDVSSVEKIAPNTGVYDHSFSILNSNQHPSLTVSHLSPNEDERFPLAMVDSMKLDITPNEYPTVEFAMMSRESIAATNTITYQEEIDFLSKQFTFKYANDIAGLGAATAVDTRALSLEIKKNIFMEYVNGNVTPVDIMNQGLEVTGNITVVHDGTTFEDIQNNEEEKAFELRFVHNSTIGSTANPEFKIQLNKVKLMNYEASRTPNDIVEESFDFEAYFSITDGEQITALLTNTQASYT